jgi:hypothetical protein
MDRGTWCEKFARDNWQPVRDWTDAHLDLARTDRGKAVEQAITDLELPGCRPPHRRLARERAADAKVLVRTLIWIRLDELTAAARVAVL